MERFAEKTLGADSIKGADGKAIMTVGAKDKNGARSIIVLGYDDAKGDVSFVSKEDYAYFETLLDCPKGLLMDRNGFRSIISSGDGDAWNVAFQVHGQGKESKSDYFGYVNIPYSKGAFARGEAMVISGINPENTLKESGEEITILSSVDRRVRSSKETRISLSGSTTWNVSDDLESNPTYQRIRGLYDDSLFEGLGTKWRFDHRYLIQDNELFVIASQSESKGGAIITKVIETEDYAFRVNVAERTFEYVGATPRGAFAGTL